MATSREFADYVCDQLRGCGEVRSRKMFGEYMVYVNDKPLFLLCDNTVFVKVLPETEALLGGAERGYPYEGAREHYILDAGDRELALAAAAALEPVTPLPKAKKKPEKTKTGPEKREFS